MVSQECCSKKLRFGIVTEHKFEVALGDCPIVSCGPPIRLGKRVMTLQLTVDQYETLRWLRPRRKQEELRIPKRLRLKYLREAGYTTKAINEATNHAMEARKLLIASIRQKGWDKFAERSESIRCALISRFPVRRNKSGFTLTPIKS